jgi:hypothetical protein
VDPELGADFFVGAAIFGDHNAAEPRKARPCNRPVSRLSLQIS